jgi:hypothetical protein
MKASLKNAGPGADEGKKALLENLIAEGERFIEVSKQFPAMNREVVPSKYSLQISGRRIGGIFKRLGIGVAISIVIAVVWKLLS